jgi:hypothetical protein
MGLPNHPFFGGPMSISFFTRKSDHMSNVIQKRRTSTEGALVRWSNGHIETQRKIVTLSDLLSVLGHSARRRQARVGWRKANAASIKKTG